MTLERDSASGFAGCNGYYYPVGLADGLWTFTEGTATITELLCVDEEGAEQSAVMRIESEFIGGLEQVVSYSLATDDLVLTGDGVELRFARSAGD